MTHSLTDPIQPDVNDPQPFGPLAGDHTDDDGVAMDEILQAPDHPPFVYDAVIPNDPEEVPSTDRIIGRRVGMSGGDDPVLFMAADPNRKNLYFYYTANNNNASVAFGSEKSNCYAGPRIQNIVTVGGTVRSNIVELRGYTGALWLYPDTTGGITYDISVWAVTK